MYLRDDKQKAGIILSLRNKVFLIILMFAGIIIISLLFIISGCVSAESTLTMNNTFSVKIPDYINYRKANYALSSEITEHFILEGTEKTDGLSGYIQTWNMTMPLSEYFEQLENSLSSSVYNYEKKPMLQNGSVGYDVSFYIEGDKYSSHILQTIWQYNDKMYVVSISAPENSKAYANLETISSGIKDSITLLKNSVQSGKLNEWYIQNI